MQLPDTYTTTEVVALYPGDPKRAFVDKQDYDRLRAEVADHIQQLRKEQLTVQAMRVEIEALKAELTHVQKSDDYNLARWREAYNHAKWQAARIRELEESLNSHAPEGHNFTNGQHIALRQQLATANALIEQARHTIEPFADIKPRMWKTDIENAKALLTAIERHKGEKS